MRLKKRLDLPPLLESRAQTTVSVEDQYSFAGSMGSECVKLDIPRIPGIGGEFPPLRAAKASSFWPPRRAGPPSPYGCESHGLRRSEKRCLSWRVLNEPPNFRAIPPTRPVFPRAGGAGVQGSRLTPTHNPRLVRARVRVCTRSRVEGGAYFFLPGMRGLQVILRG